MLRGITASQKRSKYVADITAADNGVITLTTAGASSGLPTAAQAVQIKMLPNVQGAALAVGSLGAINWACTTESANTAQSRKLANCTVPARRCLPNTRRPNVADGCCRPGRTHSLRRRLPVNYFDLQA